MAQNRPPPAVFDFSPFKDAPGVAAQMRAHGAPQIVDIPQTPIPSPLAPNLAPDTVAKLKRRLVGDGSGTRSSAGEEVWASWKRAWDLWNNHYIEGRVSPVWIKEEYERLKKEMGDARDHRRREDQMNRFKTRHQPRRRIVPVANSKATIFSKDKPQAAPGKTMRQTNETRPAKNAVVQKLQSRPKPGSTRLFRRKGSVVPVYGERFVTEIVQVERVLPRNLVSVCSWTDLVAKGKAGLPLPEGNVGPESTETVTEITFEERQVMEFGHVDVFGDKVSPKIMGYVELAEHMKSNNTLPSEDENAAKHVSQRPKIWHPVTEPCLNGERTLTVDETVPIIQFEDRLVDVLVEEDAGVLIGWIEEDEDAVMDDAGGIDDGDDIDVDGDFNVAGDFGLIPMIDEEPAVFHKARHLVEGDDGFGGGFFPMKNLDPYPETDDPDGNGGDPKWLDALQCTVWCPRRVGEKTLRIEMDDCFDDVTANKWLEADGGIDCGRSPYPVLRSVTEYVKVPKDFGGQLQGLFRKKKMWDGVTGTIFNMPMKPLEQDDTKDDRANRMQALYGDVFRDKSGQHRHEFFPLDIRRVKRRNDEHYPGRQFTTLVLERNESLVRYPWHYPEDDIGDLPSHDPWAVTAEQRHKRDVPVRRYPPAQCSKGNNHLDILPVDDSIWREELQDDDYGRWKYFVTNIHGGTLLINGKQIKKNQIAGPLPEFAVIECPGKQVAFWWGPGGRNYLEGPAGFDYEGRWETLRRTDPGMEKVALTASQEWDYKIRERITREFTGNEWEDDAEWEQWKKAIAAAEPEPTCDPAKPARIDDTPITLQKYDDYGVPLGTDVVQPECFETDKDELKWLHTKAEPLSRTIKAAQSENFIDPIQAGTNFFPGSQPPPVFPEVVKQKAATRAYKSQEQDIVKAQQDLNVLVAKAKADRAWQEKETIRLVGRKRAADSVLQGPFPKKTLADLRREAQDAEDAVKRQVDATARRDRTNIPHSLELLIRVFDKDVKSALEKNLKDWANRKAGAISDGLDFTEPKPTLNDEAEHYVTKRRKKEQHDARLLQQVRAGRIAAESPVLPDTNLTPGVDNIYAAWKDNQTAKAKELEDKAAAERRNQHALRTVNNAAEQQRVAIARVAGEAAYQRSAALQKEAEEKTAAAANLTLAEKAREKRLAGWNAIIAATKEKKAEQTRLARERADKSKVALPSPSFFQSINFESPIQTRSPNQAQIRTQTSPNKYVPGTSESTDEQAADIQYNAGPSDGLIRALPTPRMTGLSPIIATRLAEARKEMRAALARGLRARSDYEQRPEQQVVRALGYFDVDAYLTNLSNSILPADIPRDTRVQPYPSPLPTNATQTQRAEKQARISSVDIHRRVDSAPDNGDVVKRNRLNQRILDAENFVMMAKTLERKNPPRVDFYTQVAKPRRGGQQVGMVL